jgi:hypothetical protein
MDNTIVQAVEDYANTVLGKERLYKLFLASLLTAQQ